MVLRHRHRPEVYLGEVTSTAGVRALQRALTAPAGVAREVPPDSLRGQGIVSNT